MFESGILVWPRRVMASWLAEDHNTQSMRRTKRVPLMRKRKQSHPPIEKNALFRIIAVILDSEGGACKRVVIVKEETGL